MTATRYRTVLASTLAAMLLLPGAADARVRQSDGDTTVIAVGAPRHPGIARLVPDMQMGHPSDSAATQTFMNVVAVLPLEDGAMFVVQQTGGPDAIRLYDATGRFLRTIFSGIPGASGPAEIREAALLADGRALVRDAISGIMMVHDRDGDAVPFFTHTSVGPNYGPPVITVARDGAVFLRFLGRPAGQQLRQGLVRARPDGSVIDTILIPEVRRVTPLLAASSRSGGALGYEVPFAPKSLVALSPQGYFVTAITNRYAVDLLIPAGWQLSSPSPPVWQDGDRVVSIRRSVDPVMVSDAERATSREHIESELRKVDSTWQWTGAELPRQKAPITDITFGLDGRIWVRLATPSEPASGPGGVLRPPGSMQVPQTWTEPSVYDVLEPDGAYIGQVRIPDNVTILSRQGDYVWGVSREWFSTQTVTRFRIMWGAQRY